MLIVFAIFCCIRWIHHIQLYSRNFVKSVVFSNIRNIYFVRHMVFAKFTITGYIRLQLLCWAIFPIFTVFGCNLNVQLVGSLRYVCYSYSCRIQLFYNTWSIQLYCYIRFIRHVRLDSLKWLLHWRCLQYSVQFCYMWCILAILSTLGYIRCIRYAQLYLRYSQYSQLLLYFQHLFYSIPQFRTRRYIRYNLFVVFGSVVALFGHSRYNHYLCILL